MAEGPVTRILLVRHGGTTATADDRFAGSSDVMLSQFGREQARELGERLMDVDITAAYCSDMRRAIDTATLIMGPHRPMPIARPGLREIDHGHWEGLPHKLVEADYAAEYAAWSADPLDYAIPGGESGRSVLDRAAAAINEIIRENVGRTVLVVSHKATNRLLLARWLGFDPRRYRDRLGQETCCLNIVLFRGEPGPQVVLVNDTSHYERVR